MFYGMKVQPLQAAPYNLESVGLRFCCEEAGLLPLLVQLNHRERHCFTGAAAAAKAAGTEEKSSNL